MLLISLAYVHQNTRPGRPLDWSEAGLLLLGIIIRTDKRTKKDTLGTGTMIHAYGTATFLFVVYCTLT